MRLTIEVVKIVFCLFIFVLSAVALDLPQYFTKCKKNDPELNDCILKNILDSWQILIQGDLTFHIQKMDPLLVPFIQIRVDRNLYGNLTNGILTGFKEVEFKAVNVNLDKKSIEIISLWPFCSIAGDYDIKGKILGLEIMDTGSTNVTFVKGLNNLTMTYKLKEKKGKQYIHIIDSKVINKDAERIYFNMQFSRNQQLGDNINKVINDNWREVADQVRDSVGAALGGLMRELFQPFFDKVPFDKLFA